jgi:Domain of unknown function (DUF389)
VHRRLTFQGDAESLAGLAGEIAALEGVIGLARVTGGSLKPPGDLLQADVLNRDADEVLRRARRRVDDGNRKITVVISETKAVIDREREALIENDADESLWEEMESDLRNHGRVSVNFIVLMALGGAISAAGLLSEPVPRAIAFVGASIIAPGFEPAAKLAQGLILGRARVCWRALTSLLLGYAVLGAAAAGLTAIASLLHAGAPRAQVTTDALAWLERLEVIPVAASACAAVAGVLMVVSLRDLYVVGPLMVLVMIPGVALMGAALAVGEWRIALEALTRVGVDMALVVALGAAVFAWKQRAFHRRRPLP